jgi:hypothetical protein
MASRSRFRVAANVASLVTTLMLSGVVIPKISVCSWAAG